MTPAKNKEFRRSFFMSMKLLFEIVDTKENIDKILPFLDETVKGGLVTMEKAKVIKYSSSK